MCLAAKQTVQKKIFFTIFSLIEGNKTLSLEKSKSKSKSKSVF